MHIAIEVVALVAVVAAGAALARRLGISAPLLLVVIGIAASYLPFVPRVELAPEVVLVGFLPPLLYSAAIKTSLVDFSKHRRSIGLLSVGLVVFTALGVGVVAWWLLGVVAGSLGHEPLPLWAAFAIGAVVAPPDAVAATAIARRVGLPRRVVTILEGESLVNDATALVCLRTALAAAVVTPTVLHVGLDFLRAAGGGVVIGLAVAFVLAKVRRRFTDPVLDTTLSLTAPFIAYVAAEEIHASGVLAVVVTGLLLGHKSPIIQSAKSRMSERTNWRTFQFLLENTVFLLIGLQTRWILDDLAMSPLPGWLIAAATIAVFLAVVLLRPIWLIPSTIAVPARPRPVPAGTGVVAGADRRVVGRDARRRHPGRGLHPPRRHPGSRSTGLHRARRDRGHAARPGLDPALAGTAAPAARPGSGGGCAAGGRRTARCASRRRGEAAGDRHAGRPARGGQPAPAAW